MRDDPDSRVPPGEAIACDSARLQASAWIDGELPASSALVAHLDRCADCRGHALDLRALSARLVALRTAEPVADLWPGIAARARARSDPARRRDLRLRRVAAALIGCAVTAALLEAASRLAVATQDRTVVDHVEWPPALHQESTAARELRFAPEQRLLASIDPTGQGPGQGER